jgi:glyoxylase-like metal-dependent hydrolase (beta-lactamase superfamily II)
MAMSVKRGGINLSIPTPFAVGAVNVVLIEDDPLTLVDTGANLATTFPDIEAALRGLGHELADLAAVDLLREGGVVVEEDVDGVRWFACQ